MRRRSGLALAAGLLLGGCGFRLRQPPSMAFRRIALAGFAPRSPLAEEFRRVLAGTVDLVELPSQAEVVLESLVDAREKTVVASTAAGQVREVQLRQRFHFRARTPGGRVLIPTTELLLARDMSFNETQALAKEQEEARLIRDMQADIVDQVLRRLSAVRP